MTAYRVRVLRLAAGHEEDEAVEAETGALLEAETAMEISGINSMIQSYIEALKKSGQ